MVIVKAKTKDILKTFKFLKASITDSKANSVLIEITVTNGKITFAIAGAIFSIAVNTVGTGKAIVSYLNFYTFLKSLKNKDFEIIIGEQIIQIGSFSFPAKTSFTENALLLRTIILPLNYTDNDLITLIADGYTKEEIEFNKLTKSIKDAKRRISRNVSKMKKPKVSKYLKYSIYSGLFEKGQ